MSRTTERVTKVVEQVTIHCDICGSREDLPRYAENRVCTRCGRDACGKCQNIEDGEFSNGVECKICCELSGKYRPRMNAAYREIEAADAEWKAESLSKRKVERG